MSNWNTFDASFGNVLATGTHSSLYESGWLDNSSFEDPASSCTAHDIGNSQSHTEDGECYYDKRFSNSSMGCRNPPVFSQSQWQMLALDSFGTRMDDNTQFDSSAQWCNQMSPTYIEVGIRAHINDTTPMGHQASVEDQQTLESSGSLYGPRLRTADPARHPSFFGYRQHSSNDNEEVSRRERTTATKHNEVEKQYRNRLNNHFAQLLGRIPMDIVTGSGFQDGAGKGVSKADTLIMAEQYIKKLEGETKDLTGGNEDLLEEYENLKEEWIRQGGSFLP